MVAQATGEVLRQMQVLIPMGWGAMAMKMGGRHGGVLFLVVSGNQVFC
jgi:hypothetical protein